MADLAEAIGSKIMYDKSNSITIIEGGIETRFNTSQESHSVITAAEQVERALNVEIHDFGDEIIIKKPYQTKQLMVQTVNLWFKQ